MEIDRLITDDGRVDARNIQTERTVSSDECREFRNKYAGASIPKQPDKYIRKTIRRHLRSDCSHSHQPYRKENGVWVKDE